MMKLDIKKSSFNKLKPISFDQVKIMDNFWSMRQKVVQDISIYQQYRNFEDNYQIDNFRVAAGIKEGIHRGFYFLDSDLYKWLEAASYILHLNEDLELEVKVEEIISLIEKAQLKDGYINTYYSTKFLKKRFTNLLFFHELYCAGHLIQAAIAHYKATGKRRLLIIAEKFADLIVKIFLNLGVEGVPGHEEIEIALIDLFRLTKKERYLNLAKKFIDKRGNIPKYKTKVLYSILNIIRTFLHAGKIEREYKKKHKDEKESNKLDGDILDLRFLGIIKLLIRMFKYNFNGKYAQLNVPVRNATEPVGHSVRAMYLYSAMADLYSETGDKQLLIALKRIWIKMVKARMYITGGTGSVKEIEGFGKDFKLKNEDSYSETCASIGNIMWNWRMLQITAHSKYADLIEKLLYNAMLVGLSIDGRSYTYNNPLLSFGKDERQEWFSCACCPPNIARTIASLGQYIYSISEKGNELWIHQYIGNEMKIKLKNGKKLTIIQESEFPWKGFVKIKVILKNDLVFKIFLRIPNWCDEPSLRINQEKYNHDLIHGKFVEINRKWSNNDIIELNFPMKPILNKADPRIKADRGRVAISSGLFIYCIEQKDNEMIDIFEMRISKNPDLKEKYKPKLLGGIKVITGKLASKEEFVSIPYYLWCNRGKNKMQVWIKSEK